MPAFVSRSGRNWRRGYGNRAALTTSLKQPRSRSAVLKTVLRAAPLNAGWALLFGVAAIIVPTFIRAAVPGSGPGIVFTLYIPFVLLAALLLRARHAALVALGSAVVANFLFMGHPFRIALAPGDLFGVGAFLLSSALIIGFVRAARRLVTDPGPPATGEEARGVVFSAEGGQAWASWYNARPSVRLGPQTEVAVMMEDFLAQMAVGERLARRVASLQRPEVPETDRDS